MVLSKVQKSFNVDGYGRVKMIFLILQEKVFVE